MPQVASVKPKKNGKTDLSAIQTPSATKEHEPTTGEVKDALSEIVKSSESIDRELEADVQERIKEIKEVGEDEARLARPEPKIPPDVEDSGVKVVGADAQTIAKGGSSILLPASEMTYNEGLKKSLGGQVSNRVVRGASSLVGLVMEVGRMIKKAHKHAMKVIFRGGKNAD